MVAVGIQFFIHIPERDCNLMKFVYTDGKNDDFVMLCHGLDDFLNKAVGGEKQRKQYTQYNKLDDIHDAVLLYDDILPIACAGFKRYDDNTAEVKRVFIREEYRGKGISKQLMSELEEKAREKGYANLILETGRLLTAAMGLYEKMGYKVIKNYGQYKNMLDSICMKKEILLRDPNK